MEVYAPRWTEVFSRLLRETQHTQPDELIDCVNRALAPVGLRAGCYLIDEEQLNLWPTPGSDGPVAALHDTIAGRVFTELLTVPDDTGGRPDLWVPLVDGTERLGVMRFTGGPTRLPDVQERCHEVGLLLAHLIAVTGRYGDALQRVRRTRSMSIGGELLLSLLPPLTYTAQRIAISCILQPFYDPNGDAFDYAVDGAYAHLCLIDAVGHGLGSALIAAATLSALRSARRDEESLAVMGRAVDEVLERQFGGSTFVTAVLGRLNVETGHLQYVNAGHFPPLLFHNGQPVRELPGGRRLPLGLGDPSMEFGEHRLEPGDRLLLYSDGIIEARDAQGEMFGIDHLIEAVERAIAAPQPIAEAVRATARHVIDFSDGPLRDDATLMLVEWSHEAPNRMRVVRTGGTG